VRRRAVRVSSDSGRTVLHMLPSAIEAVAVAVVMPLPLENEERDNFASREF
jgi:hypothetical protein